MSKELPAHPSLAQLKKLVKELRRSHDAGDPAAVERLRRYHPKYRDFSDDDLRTQELAQRSAQLTIAREYGHESWQGLRRRVEYLESGTVDRVYDPSAKQLETQRFTRLVAACREGAMDQVESILRASPELIDRTQWYRPPLLFAVCGGHLEIVRCLLDHGAHPAHPDEKTVGDTSLDIARIRGYDDIADAIASARERRGCHTVETVTVSDHTDLSTLGQLLAEDATRERVRDEDGNTPLHRAVALADRDQVDLLLDHGAGIDAIRNDGFRPIHLALYRDGCWTNRYRNRQDLAYHLISRGARYTASIAAFLGDLDRVRSLLSKDPSLANDPDSLQKRPLSCAAEGGHLSMIELLLEHGADPNKPEANCDGDGYALFGAVVHDHYDCARMLLEHGANPNAELDSSGSVYSWCRGDKIRDLVRSFGGTVNITTHVAGEEVETVKRLLEKDPTLADDVLHVQNAAPEYEADYIEMFEAAFACGADPKACAGYSLVRALKGMPRVAELLIDYGVSPELVVHRIAREGDTDAMRVLMRKGLNLEWREDEYRGTPLTTAARAGQLQMVKLLLSRGATPRHCGDEPWSTPEFWAERNGHTEIAKILRENR